MPKYVLYSVLLTIFMWIVWNKTKFGKNMFAVGSNEEAARVSGVNVFLTIVAVFVLAGVMYGITGFIEGARCDCRVRNRRRFVCRRYRQNQRNSHRRFAVADYFCRA